MKITIYTYTIWIHGVQEYPNMDGIVQHYKIGPISGTEEEYEAMIQSIKDGVSDYIHPLIIENGDDTHFLTKNVFEKCLIKVTLYSIKTTE